MILKAADGTIYKVHFRHWLPCKRTKIRGTVYRAALFPQWTQSHRHPREIVWVKSGGRRQQFARSPRTECLLHREDCRLHVVKCLGRFADGKAESLKNYAVVAEARCNLDQDVFTKKEGRRISLERALVSLVGEGPVKGQLLANYQLQLLPRCNHKNSDGSSAWVAMEGFDFCPWCHLRRDKSVE